MKRLILAVTILTASLVGYVFLKPQWTGCACAVSAPTTMYCSAPPVEHHRFPENCIGVGW